MFKSQAELDEALRVGTVPAELAVVVGEQSTDETTVDQSSQIDKDIQELKELEQAVVLPEASEEVKKPGVIAKLLGLGGEK